MQYFNKAGKKRMVVAAKHTRTRRVRMRCSARVDFQAWTMTTHLLINTGCHPLKAVWGCAVCHPLLAAFWFQSFALT